MSDRSPVAVSEITTDTVISTRRLTKAYGRKLALHNLTLDVARGGVHAIVGSNGAGKSTLFRILLGVASATAGSGHVLGVDSRYLTPRLRGKIGFVNEEHTLPAWMSVRDVTAMHRDLYPSWNDKIHRDVVGHFHVLPEQKIGQLSRGERAGVNLSMALAQSPELLILDEPTLGLDVVAKQAFLESLLFAGDDGECTIVYCSHQMDEIERVADQLIILERGALVSTSAPDDFQARISGWLAEFSVTPPPPSMIPGLLQWRDVDGSHQLVVIDQGDDFGQLLQRLGATSVQRMQLGLDRAVNAFLTRHHSRPESRPLGDDAI